MAPQRDFLPGISVYGPGLTQCLQGAKRLMGVMIRAEKRHDDLPHAVPPYVLT
jgi:hypothetical protein